MYQPPFQGLPDDSIKPVFSNMPCS